METIHILQKTYELLYVARIPLLNYLSERLPAISSTWKRDCVERVLNEKNNRDFSELDIYYLILILQDRENRVTGKYLHLAFLKRISSNNAIAIITISGRDISRYGDDEILNI